MPLSLYLTFLMTVTIVMITPGPCVVAGITHGLRYGWKRVAALAAGDICANFIQMCVAVAGIGLVLAQSALAFAIVKYAGVAYLIYLGVSQLRSRSHATAQQETVVSLPPITWHFRQGFLIAAMSPKAILFYGALFPQFITPDTALLPQFTLMAISCAVIDFLVVLGYGWTADRTRAAFSGTRSSSWLNKLSGTMMLGAAGVLATSQR